MGFYKVTTGARKFKGQIFNDVVRIISEEGILRALEGFTKRHRIYHVWPLFQLFLHQVASNSSCRDTMAWGFANGLIPRDASPKTSAYCNARNDLPEGPLRGLALEMGWGVEAKARGREMFGGRRVKVVDGSSLQMEDTAANQAAYPQPSEQKAGCGFPVMYFCGLMGLATGALLDAAVGGRGHERALFRKLWPSLERGDIILGDNGFASYAEFAELLKLGVDAVMCQRRGVLKTKRRSRISNGEWLVHWDRPKTLGNWVGADKLPPILIVRAIRCVIPDGYGKTKDTIIFTTLLDRKRFPKKKIAQLYHRRWEMELTLRHIKTTMKIEPLKCKRPKRCRCEFWMGLLAYNILRAVMLDAAREGGLKPSRISFKGAMKRLEKLEMSGFFNDAPKMAYKMLLEHMAQDHVPYRPGRHEPRRLKRRPKQFPLLNKPRYPAPNPPLPP